MKAFIKSLIVCLVSLILLAILGTTSKAATVVLPVDPVLDTTLYISGLTQPVFITNAHDGSDRLFIAQQNGQIRIFKNGSLLASPFLDIASIVSNFTDSSGELGLLGVAFDPNYSSNGYFYITYTASNNDPDLPYSITLARYQVSSNNANLANKSSGIVLLSIPKKYTNHNGGMIAFGEDGYLYISTGDGGSGGDPDNNAQNLQALLGKVLRLDTVTSPPAGKSYVIPPTNPFYGNSNPSIRKEIWAYGLRNSWRFSFDRLTKDLYISDVGQGAREEINFQPNTSVGGENYGWKIMEGSLCYSPSAGCDQTNKTLPVAEYDHSIGCSITGGYVYRGTKYPSLYGYYIYGDYCSGRIFSLRNNPDSGWETDEVLDTSNNISTFGEDEQGELYLSDHSTGNIYFVGAGTHLTSITRTSENPTNTPSVNFNITFNQPVSDVDIDSPFADFILTTTGVPGASITGVTGSGNSYTVTVNTGTGNGTIRLDVPNTATITDLSGTPITGLPYTTGQTYEINRSMTFTSNALQDGSILEKAETGNTGGTLDSSSTKINLGDDVANKQYRAILSFDTSPLPDNAMITSVTLKFKYAGTTGTQPFNTHGNLLADIRKGSFTNNNPVLQLNDFKAIASKNSTLSYSNSMINSWFSQSLVSTNFQYINLTNITQFRLRFQTDDNHDFGADILRIYSSNAGSYVRPRLIIEYYIP